MINREEVEKHWMDTEWLLEHDVVTRRSSSDWQPIEKAIPNVGDCWVTIELFNGNRYVQKGSISEKDIERGKRREHPCIVAFMPTEIEPLPYGKEEMK